MVPPDPLATVLEVCLRVRQSGVIRVLVAQVRMIKNLWARVSKRGLLGELGILLFCSPGFCDVGGLLHALSSPPREANLFFLDHNFNTREAVVCR